MRKTAITLAALALGAALTVGARADVSFEARLTQACRVSGRLDVDVEIRSTGTEMFVLGTSTFLFSYNTGGLASPTKTGVGANDGPWDAQTDADYLNVALQSGVGWAGLTVEFQGDAENGDLNGAIVPSTFTRVGTVRFTIVDAGQSSGLAWQNIGANTQVYRLTTTGAVSLTFGAATKEITRGSGSFVTDGFTQGLSISTNATDNPGPFTLASVAALQMVVSDDDNLVNEGPVTCTATGQTDITLIGAFIDPDDIPLPIQIASLAASVVRDNDVEVAWKTVSETNNYGFEVYRKRGETGEWTKVGFVEGHGTTLAPQSYSYVDRSLFFGEYFYRIKQIDLDGKSETFPEMAVTVGAGADKFVLAQNYPNPFNPSTVIEFVVPVSGHTTLRVYNVLGQEVATLFEGNAEAGKVNAARFDASSLPSGLYFYTLKHATKTETKRMLLVK
jgi:hypothetical protein